MLLARHVALGILAGAVGCAHGGQSPDSAARSVAKIWREALDSGKGGIFTLDVAGVLDGMEKATGR